MIGDGERRAFRVNADARSVGDVLYAGRDGCFNRGAMLTLATTPDGERADEQHFLAAGECFRERIGLVEIPRADLHTARGKFGERCWITGDEYEFRRRKLLENKSRNLPAHAARRAGDDGFRQ